MNPEHSAYCNCECPEGLSYLKLEETLNRVRMLHYARSSGYPAKLFCDHCSEWNGNDKLVPYPCETMRVLAGDE